MRKPKSPSPALVVSCIALFVALGGTGLAAAGMIGTNQIKDGAVTNSKIHDNAITGAKVMDGSLNAGDIRAGTFLPFGGTAQNSDKLGNHPSSDFLLGRGSMFANRVQVPVGQTQLIVGLGFGDILGKCAAGGVPQMEYQSNRPTVNLVDWVTNYGSPNGTAAIHTTNGLTQGGIYPETNTSVVPQSITWQAAYDDGTPHIATAWTTGQDIATTSCIFIGQALSTN